MTFDEFAAQVKATMEGTAAGKNYNQTGVDGQNQLFDMVHDTVGGYGHAIGEMIYKARRFAAKGNDEDLIKMAAWAFLVLQHKSRGEAATQAHKQLIADLSGNHHSAVTPTNFFTRLTS